MFLLGSDSFSCEIFDRLKLEDVCKANSFIDGLLEKLIVIDNTYKIFLR